MINNDLSSLLNNVRTNLINISSSLKSRFYDDCIEHLDLPSVQETFYNSHEIKDKHIVEPFRLFFYREFTKYYFYCIDYYPDSLISSIIEHCIIHKLDLISDNARINLLRQLDVLENDDIYRFKQDIPNNLKNIKNILFVASSIDLSSEINNLNMHFVPLKNKRSLNLFLNNYTLTFLKHQDLDRFTNYLSSADNYVQKSVMMFKNVYNLFKRIELRDVLSYERLMLFSGFVLHTLGTTYTTDADVIYNGRGLTNDKIKSMTDELDTLSDIEYFVYTDRDSNIEYISDLITDPDRHYFFLGMKIINISSHIRRLYQRASPSSFVDLIMLNKINEYNIKPCIPIMTIDEGEITVYTKKMIDIKLRTTQKYFREWHNINYSISDLKELIKRCKDYPNDPPFYKSLGIDPFTIVLDSYLYYGVLDIVNENFNNNDTDNDNDTYNDTDNDTYNDTDNDTYNDNKQKLLILDDSKEYPRYYPKKGSSVTIMEPAESPLTDVFIKMTNKKKLSRTTNVYDMKPLDYTSVWGTNSKYDNVFVNYSLKYLITDSDKMMKNLNNSTNAGSNVLVIFIDGNVIENILNFHSGRFEIKDDDNKTIIGLYRYDYAFNVKGTKLEQFVLFIRGTLRFGTGSVEFIIYEKDLQNLFVSNGYSVTLSGSLADKQESYVTNDRHITSDKDRTNLLEVLGWFKYILFKR